MRKRSNPPCIRLRGVRQNNLKGINLDLPLGRLLVFTGLSGSGKSSLAFDTLFAEGQRRYIETFSPYARQFFDRMDKPQADQIAGIPPAIAIEQRNSVRTTRSTVGTMTEICDYTKLVWPHLAQLHCRQCGRLVRKDTPAQIWEAFRDSDELIVTFSLALSQALSLEETLDLIVKQGYQRLLLPLDSLSGSSTDHETQASSSNPGEPAMEIVRIDEAVDRLAKSRPNSLAVVQDRVKRASANRARFVEACEQAYHFGKSKLAVYRLLDSALLNSLHRFSNRVHCATCDIDYRESVPALFSYNHPLGACPKCHGFGRIISIDYNLAIPDRNKTLAEGAVRPWQSGHSAECQDDLMRFCRIRHVPTDTPFARLSRTHQQWLLDGDPGYGKDKQHEWPNAWYGVKGYFRWLESKAYKMHVRVLLSRYRAYTPCPECQGRRFQPEALLYRVAPQRAVGPSAAGNAPASEADAPSPAVVGVSTPKATGVSISEFYQMPIQQACRFIEAAASCRPGLTDPIRLALEEVRARLSYLVEVGLGYLTLDRPTRSLSGGETERVNLTTCLGTRLVNTLFILDEPSVGLHCRDTERLVKILEHLRDAGNTVAVVEHEPAVIRAADQVVDLGPGSGEAGGRVVFQGSLPQLLDSPDSLTGQYLSGRKSIPLPKRRSVLTRRDEAGDVQFTGPALAIEHASLHNLRDLTVALPLGRFVCVTGVSGSGKTTLVRDVLLPTLLENLQQQQAAADAEDDSESHESNSPEEPTPDNCRPPCQIKGVEHLGRVILVDQSGLGKTPRSNPAVYIGAFGDLREVFAQSELAHRRGLDASAFSFNSAQGQCERCRGAGFEKIEMQFLSDVFVRCPDCNGRRYRPHILEVKLKRPGSRSAWSIADLLEATVDDAIAFLEGAMESRPARRACQALQLLQQVGLGYLRLGQPINTLSGGESQRLKLVRHLAEFSAASELDSKPTLFLLDEPTTGLHFDDVRVLLTVFQKLVDSGHSVLVIEHNLEVIKSADWVIDLGPEAGADGGRIVSQGPPEHVAACAASYTGQALKPLL